MNWLARILADGFVLELWKADGRASGYCCSASRGRNENQFIAKSPTAHGAAKYAIILLKNDEDEKDRGQNS